MTTEKTLDLGVDAIHSCVYRTSYRDLQQLISIYRFVIPAFTISCECVVVIHRKLNANLAPTGSSEFLPSVCLALKCDDDQTMTPPQVGSSFLPGPANVCFLRSG